MMTALPVLRTASTRSHESAGSIVNGFSHRTCEPASSAAFAWRWCFATGLPTTTMSHRSAMTSSQLVVALRKPNSSLIFHTSSGFRRFTIVKSTSSRHRSRFGRWELTVHEPAPITPRRSFATATVPVLLLASSPRTVKLRGARGGCQKSGRADPRATPYDRKERGRRGREVTMSRVVKVEPIPVSYPEPNDFNAIRHLCLVKITTDDGVVGWGESITQFPEASLATKAIVDGMAERVVGKDPIETNAIWQSLHDKAWWYGYNGGIASYAIAAIDIALWDIKGKVLGPPVLQLLCGAVHERLPAIASCDAHHDAVGPIAEHAEDWTAPGLRGAQLVSSTTDVRRTLTRGRRRSPRRRVSRSALARRPVRCSSSSRSATRCSTSW